MSLRSTCPTHTRYAKDCAECPIYARIYRRTRRREMQAGTWSGKMLTGERLERVRRHVAALLAGPDVFGQQIADASGVCISAVYRLNRGITKSMHPEVGRALLALTPAECARRAVAASSAAMIDGTGARRMLQALAADGWDSQRLSVLSGIHPSELRRHRRGDRRLIRAYNRDKIAEVYHKIQSQADPSGGSDRARKLARRCGWLPPERWADEDIDNPAAEPLPPEPDTPDHVEVRQLIDGCLRDPHEGRGADLPLGVKRELARHAVGRLGWPQHQVAWLLGYKSAGQVGYLLNGRADRKEQE